MSSSSDSGPGGGLDPDDFDSLEDYAQALIDRRASSDDDEAADGEGLDGEGLDGEEAGAEQAADEDGGPEQGDPDQGDEQGSGLELSEDDYFNPKLLNEKINSTPELKAALEKAPELRNAMFRNARLASETSRYKELFPDVDSARYAAETSATFRQLDDLFLGATTPQGTGRFLQKWAEMSGLKKKRWSSFRRFGVIRTICAMPGAGCS